MGQEQWQVNWADYYQVLGVGPSASPDEVRAAYLYRARLLHPDRAADLPESVRRRAERDLVLANEAYEVLRDPARRATYDRYWRERAVDGAAGRSGAAVGPGESFAPGIGRFLRSGEAGRAIQALFSVLTIATLVYVAMQFLGRTPPGYYRIVLLVAVGMALFWLYQRARRPRR